MNDAETVRYVFHYDAESGVFRRRVSAGGALAGSIAGTINNGYVRINFMGKLHYAHRLAWLYMTGEWPLAEVDHRNGSRTDNRWKNLRAASPLENRRNVGKRRNNTSGFKGAFFHKKSGRWTSEITVNNQVKYLGCYETPEAAHAAYCAAAERYHGEFARTA